MTSEADGSAISDITFEQVSGDEKALSTTTARNHMQPNIRHQSCPTPVRSDPVLGYYLSI